MMLKHGDEECTLQWPVLVQQRSLTTPVLRLLLQNCRNCLVASDPTGKYGACAKIADLGVSRALQQHKTHRTTQNLGTITHTAPELLRYGRMSPAR
jgi:hypothetical protein